MDPSVTDDEERRRIKLQEALDETASAAGYPPQTVQWVFATIVNRPPPLPAEGGSRRGLSADELCEMLIRQVNVECPGDLQWMLESNRIERSEDVGAIVTALIERDLIRREEDDYFTDFDGLFETDDLDPFLSAHGIRRRWLDWPGVQRRLSIALLVLGVAALAGSQLDYEFMPPVGVAFALVTLGAAVRFLPRRGRK